MEFGWVNLLGAIIIVLIMIPNIIYAIKNKGQQAEEPRYKAMLIIEQIGRYSCIVFMWLPLLVWEFGFNSVAEMFVYLISNAILLVAYYTFWILYSRKKKKVIAFALAILPTCIFLISGILLHHWLLVISAILFGIGHVYITSNGEYVA